MRSILYPYILSLLSLAAQGQGDWKLRSDKDGIKTFIENNPDSRIKSIRLETVFPASLAKTVAVIADISSYEKWVYNTRSARILQKVSAVEFFYYSELGFPWPAANRDFVSHVRISQDPKTKKVRILASNTSGMEPPHPKLVRMHYGEGIWELAALSENEVSVVYTLHADPAGELPAWIVNGFVTQGPQHSFRQLRAYLQQVSIPGFVLPY